MVPVAPIAIGRYVLYDAVAADPTSTLHLGRRRDAAGAGAVVAVKRMSPELARDPNAMMAIDEQARVMMLVRHPHVVSVFDVVAQEGELLEVFEYVHGVSLAELLRTGVASMSTAVAIAVDVLVGLHAMHETRGALGEPLAIVHGAISPQTILVGDDGVSRVDDKVMRKGAAAYLAPEQVLGQRFDLRADVYSVCAVLWEMLARRPLWGAEATNDMQVLERRVRAGEIPPLRAVGVMVPAALEAALRAGLATNPIERPRSALELANMLETALPSGPRAAVAQWVAEQAGATLQQRAARVLAIAQAADPALTADPFRGARPPELAPDTAALAAIVARSSQSNPPPKSSSISPWIGIVALVFVIGMFLFYRYEQGRAYKHMQEQIQHDAEQSAKKL